MKYCFFTMCYTTTFPKNKHIIRIHGRPWSSSTGETVVVIERQNAHAHPIRAGLVVIEQRHVHGIQTAYGWSMGFGERRRLPNGDQTARRLWCIEDDLTSMCQTLLPSETYFNWL